MANLSTALTLIAALATCDSAWCLEDAVEPARAAPHAAEERYGATATALVEPLTGLATALSAAGKSAAAIEALTRAVGILRRNAGLYDHRQYALLNQLTDLQSVRGEIDPAVAALVYMERASVSEHMAGSLSSTRCRSRRSQPGSAASAGSTAVASVIAAASSVCARRRTRST